MTNYRLVFQNKFSLEGTSLLKLLQLVYYLLYLLHLLLGTFDSMHPLWTLAYIGDNLVVAYLPVMVIFTVISAIEIGLIVLKPFGLSLLVKVLTSLIVYPTTSNWLFFQGSIKFMTQLQKAMDGNTKMFKTLKPSAPNFPITRRTRKILPS